METEPTKRSHSAHRKRRERAHQLQLEKFKSDDDSAEDEKEFNGVGKDKGRSRPRKKRTGAGTYEEDIIDGFAIVSFKTANDLEKFAAGKLSSKKNLSARQNNLMLPNSNRNNNKERRTPLPKIVKKPSNSLLNSEDSGENTDILDTTDLILNGPSRIISRRYSDCDSESGDEHISDASTDTFASPVNRSFNRDVIPGLQVSPPSTAVTTTVCMVTTTTSDITVTTVTTTTSCGTLAPTTSTTPIITTAATPAVLNSNQHSYLPNNCHSHIANQHNSVTQQQLQPASDKLQPVGDNYHKSENYPTGIQNSEIYPSKRENFPAKSESFLTNHHKTNYLAGNLKSDNFVVSQYHSAGQVQHQPDNYQPSHPKRDNFTSSHYKSDNFHTSHHKSDSQPAGIHKSDSFPAGVIHHKSENYPAGHHRNENYPVSHSKNDSHATSHQKSEHVSTSHLNSDNSVDKQRYPNTVNNHHLHTPHHHSQYHQQQQQQQQHHRHTSASREASQILHKSHSEAIIRHHENSRQPSPNSLKRVPSPATKRGPSSGIPPTPPLTKSQQFVPKTQPSASVSSLSSSSVIREHKRTPPPAKTPRREEPRERESHQVLPPSLTVSKSPFLGLQGHHGSTTPILYSPLGPSPGLPLPLHSTPSHSTLPGAPSVSPLHPQPPTPSHNMFAPPMPLGPPAGPLGGATPAPSPQVIPDPDMLREELNRRFLASTQDRSVLQAMPGFLKADFHQHMHQHQHQHTHNHTYHGGLGPPPPGAANSIIPPPAAHMYDYRPGLPHRPRGHIAEPDPRHIANGKDKPVLPQHPASALPGLSSYPSLLLNPAATPGAGPLGTGLSGAFQPKNVSSLHPAHQLLMPLRDRDKSGIPPSPQPNLTGTKKPGKWCAAHVRIAWEIYHHQQKSSDKGPTENKMADPLRPPSHLLPVSMIQRPQDYTNSASTSGLGSGRGLFDASPHTLLGAPQIAPPSFPRPSPYSIGTSLNLGNLGNGLVSTSREPAISISSGSHEWNRLHRTPPTFPTPPAWAKTEDREKEFERERSLERRREEERERERRLSIDDRHRFQSLDERSRDRLRDSDILVKSRSRSRSRSPVRNGRVDSAKLTDRRYDENPLMKIKEERREREDLMSERDRLLKNEMSEREQMMKNEFLRTTDPFLQASTMDRTRMLVPGFFGAERFPNPSAMWNPFDKGPLDFQNHRLGIQRDLEPNRNPLLTRFPHPQTVTSMAVLEQERLKEELLLREERARREYLDGLPLFERERLFYENSKIPTLRPPENLVVGLGHHFPRTLSPALGHPSLIKRSSPAVMPGAPPPLIHTVSAPPNRGHNPAMINKNKGVSPIDSVGESKCDSNSNSTDPDAHSR